MALAPGSGDLQVVLTANTAQFHQGLSQAVRQTQAASANMQRALVTTAVAGDRLTRSSGTMRGALSGVSLQMQDVVVQLSAGANPLQVLIQQGGQIAGAFGPAFGPAGLLIAGVGAAAFAITKLTGGVDELKLATEAAEMTQKALDQTMVDSVKSADELATKYRELTGELREFERIKLSAELRDIANDQDELRKKVEATLAPLREQFKILESLEREQEFAALAPGELQSRGLGRLTMPEGTLPLERRREARAAFERFQQTGDAQALAVELNRIAVISGDAGQGLLKLSDQIIGPAEEIGKLGERAELLNAAFRELLGTATDADRELIDRGTGSGGRRRDEGVPGAPRPAFRPAAFMGMTREQFEEQFDNRPTVPGAPIPAERPRAFLGMTREDFDEQFDDPFEGGFLADLGRMFDDAGVSADRLGDSLGNALTSGIQHAEDFGAALRNVFLNAFSNVGSSLLSTGIGAGLRGIGSLLGFAAGGSPPVGVPSIVGERGPELFVPRMPGTIVPNHALRSMGGGPSAVYNIDARGASVEAVARLEQMLVRLNASVESRAVGAVANEVSRGTAAGRIITGRR